jgi:ATP-dependent DNA helicase RecQ
MWLAPGIHGEVNDGSIPLCPHPSSWLGRISLLSHHSKSLLQARRVMEQVFSFQGFRPGQEAILESVFTGKDTLVVMPTGAGKSLCYQLPALVLPGVTLILSPLIALMKDQVDTLRGKGLPAVSIHSLMALSEQEEVLNRIASGKVKLVYVAPERLRNGPFLNILKKATLSLVAVDEAHCISAWGHDFRPDYLKIGPVLEGLGRPQVIALTATATEKVRADIITQLRLRLPQQWITGFNRENLFFEVLHARHTREKMSHLADRLRKLQGAAIVYAGTRKNVETIIRCLDQEDIEALGYHAGMEDDERTRIQEAFMEGKSDLIVATNAFGMGIDRSDIRMIIHYQVPGSVEAYYQECGRAGRDGRPSSCLLLYAPSDRRLQEFFIEMNYPSRETVEAVYQALLRRTENPVWLTHHEIGLLCNPQAEEMAVSSSLKILEEAGLVHRLHRNENLAELYLRHRPEEILKSRSGGSPGKIAFLRALLKHFTSEELLDGIQFLPEEMSQTAGLSRDSFRRVMEDLEDRDEGTYIPPFRGRGVRLLTRIPSSRLPVDFEKLRLRKNYQIEKLDRMMAYGTTDHCRRAFLLEYFGEQHASDHCGGCDLCRTQRNPSAPSPDPDPLLAIKIMSGVARLKGRFGAGTAAKMLTGSKEKSIEKFNLNKLTTYGLLSPYTQQQVEGWIRELLGRGFLRQEFLLSGKNQVPTLSVTPTGWESMKRMDRISLSQATGAIAKGERKVPQEGGFEERLFEKLRRLRTGIARSRGIPPYCIFHDRTLQEMASKLPDTPEKLKGIIGVGDITFIKYGKMFLKVIASWKSKKKKPGDSFGVATPTH